MKITLKLVITFAAFVLPTLFNGVDLNAAIAEKSIPTVLKRTQVKLQKDAVDRFERPSSLIRAISLQPVLNARDEVTCMRISEIRDSIIRDVYGAREGDCLSEVRIFHNGRQGISSEVYTVSSVADALVLYKDLIGAQRVDIDLKRNNKIIEMTYLVE